MVPVLHTALVPQVKVVLTVDCSSAIVAPVKQPARSTHTLAYHGQPNLARAPGRDDCIGTSLLGPLQPIIDIQLISIGRMVNSRNCVRTSDLRRNPSSCPPC